MFVVIDGIDGSGKGTQVQLIKEHFESLGKRVKVLDYPRYNENSSFMVKKYLNGEYGKYVSPKAASIFYAVDRYDSSFQIKEELNQYDYIISNRYVSANMIHQAGKIDNENEFQEFLKWLYDLEYNIFQIPKPDGVIFLNVTPEISQKLVLEKEQRNYIKGEKKMDMHEADLEHLSKAWRKAIKIVDMFDDWIQIDCVKNGEMLPIPEVTQKILFEISELGKRLETKAK